MNSTPTLPPRPRILIVDDDRGTTLMLSHLLEDNAITQSTTCGVEALRLATESRPDLILLDIEMPDISGISVCEQIKAHPDLHDTLVLFVTGHGDAQIEALALTAGAIDFIQKPVNAAVVRARVRNYLALKRQRDQLRQLSTVDGLTGVANRRAFDIALNREWARARRSGEPIALLMCDIDDFKQFNDSYGHLAGDACLHDVAAELLRHTRRAGDLVARYGGEEFAVLLPNCSSADARTLGESIVVTVAALAIPHASSRVAPHVTLSVGAGLMAPHDRAPQDLIRTADAALYRAKRSGRNRLEMGEQ
jgi:diguanylate cyclase (GGDEF)-like protein